MRLSKPTTVRPGARAALVAATCAVSFSAIFIRLADSDALTIVWVRLGLASILLLPLVAREVRSHRPTAREVWVAVAAGVLLAIHFLTWTESLARTSIASSVLLVSLHPLIVAPVGRRLLGERVSPSMIGGIALALAGTAVTCVGDFRIGGAITGDLLALAGAVSFAAYLLLGRLARTAQGAASYSAIAYVVVAVVTVGLAGSLQMLHAPSVRTFWACLALAGICTVGGHTVFNWVLRHLRVATVSVALLGEPPLTALLAIVILGQIPTTATIVGGLLILPGIALALRETAPTAVMTDAAG
jgi:drug/metabolite transporter (DMT)-like permease